VITRLLRRLEESFVAVAATDADRLLLTPLLPDTHPLDPDLLVECRRRKAELLAYVRFSEWADGHLLEASRRLAASWEEEPRTVSAHEFWGVRLAGDADWLSAESVVRNAYLSQDKNGLLLALADRDRLVKARMALVKRVTA
jgi:hypothetical protein